MPKCSYFFELQTKVKLAKLVVDVLPGEAGLRLLVNIFPEKIQVVFDGLLNSYKSQLYIALKDEKKASGAVTFIFKVKALRVVFLLLY